MTRGRISLALIAWLVLATFASSADAAAIRSFPVAGGEAGVGASSDGGVWVTTSSSLRHLTATGVADREIRVPPPFDPPEDVSEVGDGGVVVAWGSAGPVQRLSADGDVLWSAPGSSAVRTAIVRLRAVQAGDPPPPVQR
jgi:hypothetical protein